MVYADHAATTQLDREVLNSMLPYLQNEYGNPSTAYSNSRKPKKAVAIARKKIAKAIGANSDEIYFTSCGTESDNWAIKGVAFQYVGKRKRIITSCVEHHAVLNSCAFLEKLGFDVVYLPVDEQGIVAEEILENEITPNTVLVSIMLANNEIGTIENITELAQIAHRHNVLFHTDAVQAVGHIPVNVQKLGADMLSASAHKFNGPKGIGLLYIRNGVKIQSLISGGGQEKGSRAGTENVASIVGMATALELNCNEIDKNMKYVNSLCNRFLKKVHESNLQFRINGSERRIPGNISISFHQAEGEMLLHRLDLMGISVATGSACNSKETILSHVIQAIHVPEAYAHGTIRVSFGKENSSEDVDIVVSALSTILK